MALDGLAEEAARIERCSVGRNNYADFSLRNHSSVSHSDPEEIRMDWPQPGWQRSQLNTFHSTLLDEGDWVLEIVVCVLCAVWGEDASGKHWFTINSFDDAEFIRADFNQWDLAHDAFKRKLDQVQTRFEYVSLNAYFTFRRYNSSWRHLCAEIPSFFYSDFTRTYVYKNALHYNEERN